MLRTTRKQNTTSNRARGTAPLRRPGAVGDQSDSRSADRSVSVVEGGKSFGGMGFGVQHPLCRTDENARLLGHEDKIKQAFDSIVPVSYTHLTLPTTPY